MRRLIPLVVIFALVGALSAQSKSSTPLSMYAGKWQASFQGAPFYTLVLTAKGKTLTGDIQHTRDIHVNNKGEVDKIAPDMSEEQLVEAKLVGDHLRIVGKDGETQQKNVYELRLTSKDEGLLRMLVKHAPANVPTIQPWKVTRISAK